MVEADRRRLFPPCLQGRALGSGGKFAPEHVNRLAKLKKADIASEAERLAEGTRWMPAVFKTGHDTEPQESAQGTANKADAPEEAAGEEAAHALAA